MYPEYYSTVKTVFKTAVAALGFAAILFSPSSPLAGDLQEFDDSLFALSLEELMGVEVTSVSKKPQLIREIASAISVVTAADIRRAGARTIPEALQLVPGLEAVRFNANSWAITSRGFNGRFADKMLVLIDGRSIYTPLLPGVSWETLDTFVPDIEQIEVIRGPGAAVWGSNAVNGVINIITKTTDKTLGSLLVSETGTETPRAFAARHGRKLGEHAALRVFAQHRRIDDSKLSNGVPARDGFEIHRAGFRLDWQPKPSDEVRLMGDLYQGEGGDVLDLSLFAGPGSSTTAENDYKGGFLQFEWERFFDDASRLTFRTYYSLSDATRISVADDESTIADVDLQYQFKPASGHEIVAGASYRRTANKSKANSIAALGSPVVSKDVTDHQYSAFVQDEWSLIPEKLTLTLGSKFEINDTTGFEVQPTARFAWTPSDRHMLWGAVSRATRIPSQVETSFALSLTVPPFNAFNPSPFPLTAALQEVTDLEAESMIAWELGYRYTPGANLSLDVAGYYNQYDDLVTLEFSTPVFVAGPPPRLAATLSGDNQGSAESYGLEIAANWKPRDWLQLKSGYVWQRLAYHVDPGSTDFFREPQEGFSPQQRLFLRSSVAMGSDIHWDTSANVTDNRPGYNLGMQLRLDSHLSWKPRPGLEISLGGRNLTDDRTRETGPDIPIFGPTETEREFRVQARFAF